METTIPESQLPYLARLAAGVDVHYSRIVPSTATATLTIDDNHALITDATDNAVITLPLASTVSGMRVTVMNIAASTAAKVSISPNAADKVVGSVAAVASGGVANKDWISTKATSVKGDYTTLISDGGTTWYCIGGVGVWASET